MTPKKWSQKEAQKLHIENSRLSLENMKLKLELEHQVVVGLNQMQDFFGVVDSFFTEDDVRTLREAQTKWDKFCDALEDTQDFETALAAINRVSIARPEQNAALLQKCWGKENEKV
jgi:hypothetical protein